MRIGLFTDTYYPQVNGVATSILTLKRQLEKVGHKVYVFTTTDAQAPVTELNVYRVPSVPAVCEKRLAVIYKPRLAKVIKGLNLDVIHTHTEFSLGLFGRMMAKELGIPHLHTYHTIYEDYTHYIIKLKSLNPLAKSAVRRMSAIFCNSADHVIVPTEKVKELLLSYDVEPKMTVVPSGINLDKFAPTGFVPGNIKALRESLGVKKEEKVILYLGRVSQEKNIEELFIHLQDYLKARKEIKFVLVGGGPELGVLKVRAKALGIEESIVFVGEVPWNEVGKYYQTADVFVSASQSETQGITYIEALAAGVPVLAKEDPCLDGVLTPGVNGYTFIDGSTFLDGLEAIFSDASLGTRALQSVDKFSDYQFALKIEDLYRSEVLKRKALVKTNEGEMKNA